MLKEALLRQRVTGRTRMLVGMLTIGLNKIAAITKGITCNCLRAFWPTGYQHGSLGKSHQNGDYLKGEMWKSYPTAGFEPAAFALPAHCSTT